MASDIPIADIIRRLPSRSHDAHKGTFGRLVVVAGARGFTGAAMLACAAAHRTGVGLVTLALPEPLVDALAPALLETMSLPLPSTHAASFAKDAAQPLLAFAGACDAMAIGPGLSQQKDIPAFVQQVLEAYPRPMVVDADALNALSEIGPAAALNNNPGPRILTPHPGEMARLTGHSVADIQHDRAGAAKAFADAHHCIVCLKGAGTIVAAPGQEPVQNPTGNPGMATGGTGDVLTGMVGGLLAQGLAPVDAAQLAVYAHGLAGDLAAAKHTQRAVIASDLIANLPEAWLRLEENA